jgi:hypothetical protein
VPRASFFFWNRLRTGPRGDGICGWFQRDFLRGEIAAAGAQVVPVAESALHHSHTGREKSIEK